MITTKSLIRDLLYVSPVVNYRQYGRDFLLKVAEAWEAGRRERADQYANIVRDRYGKSEHTNLMQRRIYRMSLEELEQAIKNEGQDILPGPEKYKGSELALYIARSQAGNALHHAGKAETAKDLWYESLHTDEIWLLVRVLKLGEYQTAKDACKGIIAKMKQFRNEKEAEKICA